MTDDDWGLDTLSTDAQRSNKSVLRYLKRHPGFTVFAATSNPIIAATMTRIVKLGLIEVIKEPFPWSRAKLTAAGRKLLVKSRTTTTASVPRRHAEPRRGKNRPGVPKEQWSVYIGPKKKA